MKALSLTIFLLIAFLVSCIYLRAPAKHQLISNKIIASSSKKISEKCGLEYMSNGGNMKEDIKMLELNFNSKQLGKIENARKVAVDSINLFLDEINSNKEVRPYLHNYPFTAKNIQLMIFFDENIQEINPNHITNVTAAEGYINYCVTQNNRYTSFHTETFTEARDILKKKNIPLSSKLKNHQK